MKITTSLAGVLLATLMAVAVGPVQASCYKPSPGWHMVPKTCDFHPAESWRDYASGYHVQPQSDNSLPFVSG